MTTKPTNPKDALAVDRVPLHLVPGPALAQQAVAHADGAAKYGPFNWRECGVRSSVYASAAMRHITAWFDGEDVAADSGVHHLAHAIAGLNIVLDAEACGMLNDDRPVSAPTAKLQADLKKLVAKFRERSGKVVPPADPPKLLDLEVDLYGPGRMRESVRVRIRPGTAPVIRVPRGCHDRCRRVYNLDGEYLGEVVFEFGEVGRREIKPRAGVTRWLLTTADFVEPIPN